MALHRRINRLHWAHPLEGRPASIPNSRPRGAKAAGLRYERALAKHLPEATHGQWFEFSDGNGHGYCQTDLLMPFLPHFIAIIEIKYTLVPNAFSKMLDLYIPVVSKAMGCPVAGIIAVKNLEYAYCEDNFVFAELPGAANASYRQQYPTILHWRGQNLMPASQRRAA